MIGTEEEKKAWKELLENGQITEETYYSEIERIDRRILYETSKSSSNILRLIPKIMVLFFVVTIVIIGINTFTFNKPTEKIKSLRNISEPIQRYAEGSTTKIINGKNITINYIASYEIKGKVVDVQKYYGSSLQNKLSPLDVGIAWGFLAEDSDEKVTWTSNGTRFLRWRTKDMDWYNKHGGEKGIGKYWSNNHLIPSDKKIEKLIKNVKKDDYVKIEGYLVNVRYDEPDGGWFRWNSSTTREDDGNGACEIIYVTDFVWLKEE